MKPRKATYVFHRYLGLVVSLQLLAWSVGGFTFSILPLDLVRGERDSTSPPFETLSPAALTLLPAPVQQTVAARQQSGHTIGQVDLCDRGLGPFWEVRDTNGDLIARLDPQSGLEMPPISIEQAILLADRDFGPPYTGAQVRLIESDPPIEYRSGPLPAYAVQLDHPKRPHIYIDARSGQITARRNRPWRIFDFFWMLHTMDYAGRDDFNHPLLTGFSVLAIASAGSGLALWGWRAMPRRRSAR